MVARGRVTRTRVTRHRVTRLGVTRVCGTVSHRLWVTRAHGHKGTWSQGVGSHGPYPVGSRGLGSQGLGSQGLGSQGFVGKCPTDCGSQGPGSQGHSTPSHCVFLEPLGTAREIAVEARCLRALNRRPFSPSRFLLPTSIEKDLSGIPRSIIAKFCIASPM